MYQQGLHRLGIEITVNGQSSLPNDEFNKMIDLFYELVAMSLPTSMRKISFLQHEPE